MQNNKKVDPIKKIFNLLDPLISNSKKKDLITKYKKQIKKENFSGLLEILNIKDSKKIYSTNILTFVLLWIDLEESKKYDIGLIKQILIFLKRKHNNDDVLCCLTILINLQTKDKELFAKSIDIDQKKQLFELMIYNKNISNIIGMKFIILILSDLKITDNDLFLKDKLITFIEILKNYSFDKCFLISSLKIIEKFIIIKNPNCYNLNENLFFGLLKNIYGNDNIFTIAKNYLKLIIKQIKELKITSKKLVFNKTENITTHIINL